MTEESIRGPLICLLEVEACGETAGARMNLVLVEKSKDLILHSMESCLLNNNMTTVIIKVALAKDDPECMLGGSHAGCVCVCVVFV